MFEFDNVRYCIFAGNYGSGKTELSLNLAIDMQKQGKSTVLCDMDIVNPYFRSAEHRDMLEARGIRLITPPFAGTAVDIPALAAEVQASFEYPFAVFDAGGDPVGAAALGTYHGRFEQSREETLFLYVVNARRPLQLKALEVAEMLRQIEDAARLKIDGLVNNTNLARETTWQDLEYGSELCQEVSQITGIPVEFTSGTPEVLRAYEAHGFEEDTFPLTIYTRPDWLDETADEETAKAPASGGKLAPKAADDTM
ncbi:MAG: hypothetical protein HDQ87_03975 [Clostridia bacterium]|nr:hypothetical protein [Clostridia bacterium]